MAGLALGGIARARNEPARRAVGSGVSAAARSEPLGWLAPLVVAPPAAVLGAAVGGAPLGPDDPNLVWSLVGALTAGLLAALSGCSGMRERRPERLWGRVATSAALAGGILLLATLGARELVSTGSLGWGLRDGGFLFGYGAVGGLAFGLVAGLWLALMLRLRRGPSRTRRMAILGGTGWVATAAALLVPAPHASAPALVLLVCGLAALMLSPLLGARDGLAPDAPEVLQAAPQATGRSSLGGLLLLGPGFPLGLVVLERVVPDSMHEGGLDLLVASVVPALLAALVGAWSMRGGAGPAHIGVRALAACLFAGAACAPLTYLTLVASGGAGFSLRDLGLVSLIGGGVGIPIGLALGVPFAAAVAALSRLSRGALARPIERAWLGVVWLAAGAAAIGVSRLLPLDGWLRPAEVMTGQALITALVVMAVGMGVAAAAALQLARAWRLLVQAREGRLSAYAVIARSELDDAMIAALPAYLPFGRLDAVLVRRDDPKSAPFRDATVSEPLALVPGTRTP